MRRTLGRSRRRARSSPVFGVAGTVCGVEIKEYVIEPGADLRGADLSGADLEGVNLPRANLAGADFAGANLRGADLTAAFRGQPLSRMDLDGADPADVTGLQ